MKQLKIRIVIYHTGREEYCSQSPKYLFEFPYPTGDAAKYTVSFGVKTVGTEGASVGGWVDEVLAHDPSTDIHPADSHPPPLGNDVIPVEELRNLDLVFDGADSRRADFFFYRSICMRPEGVLFVALQSSSDVLQ